MCDRSTPTPRLRAPSHKIDLGTVVGDLDGLGWRLEGTPLFGRGDAVGPMLEPGKLIEPQGRLGFDLLGAVLRTGQGQPDPWDAFMLLWGHCHRPPKVEPGSRGRTTGVMAVRMIQRGFERGRHEQEQEAHRTERPQPHPPAMDTLQTGQVWHQGIEAALVHCTSSMG